MDFQVYKSDDGCMVVQSKYDSFVASYKHGEWHNELIFEPFELRELPKVDDESEASRIVMQAKKALSRW
jgi:hypothetical protein